MPQKFINLGSIQSDGIYDSDRTFATKVNENFAEVFAAQKNSLICTVRPIELNALKVGTTTTRDEGRMLLTVGPFGVTSLRLAFGNWYVTLGEQTTGLAAITVNAGLETTTPIRTRPVLFSGQRSIVIQPGDTVYSDPIPIDLAPGASVWCRTSCTVADGTTAWPAVYATRVTGENWLQSTLGTTQVYNTGALVTTDASANIGFGPIAVLGTPDPTSSAVSRKCVICLGDSIMRGNGDTPSTINGTAGYSRGLTHTDGSVVPNIVQARDSDQASYNSDTATNAAWRKPGLWPYATHMLCNFGTNDLAAGGRTLVQLQTDLTAIWTRAKRYGMKVAQVLILPRQASAGGAPVAGFESGGNLRDPQNAWIRSQVGNGLLDAVVDVPSLVEDPAVLGQYRAGISVDGIHMNASGYNLAIPAIQSWIRSS